MSVEYRHFGEATPGQLGELKERLGRECLKWGVKHNTATRQLGADVVEGAGKAVTETWNKDRRYHGIDAATMAEDWRRFGEATWAQVDELRHRLSETCSAWGREHEIATGAMHANLRSALAETLIALWKLDRGGQDGVDLGREVAAPSSKPSVSDAELACDDPECGG